MFKTAPENSEFICVFRVTVSFTNAMEFPAELDGIGACIWEDGGWGTGKLWFSLIFWGIFDCDVLICSELTLKSEIIGSGSTHVLELHGLGKLLAVGLGVAGYFWNCYWFWRIWTNADCRWWLRRSYIWKNSWTLLVLLLRHCRVIHYRLNMSVPAYLHDISWGNAGVTKLLHQVLSGWVVCKPFIFV